MFAAGVMALTITTSITTMQSALLALDSARNITIAGQIIQGELERMRRKNWAEVVAAYPATTRPASPAERASGAALFP